MTTAFGDYLNRECRAARAICPGCHHGLHVMVRARADAAPVTCPHCGAEIRLEIGRVDVTASLLKRGHQ